MSYKRINKTSSPKKKKSKSQTLPKEKFNFSKKAGDSLTKDGIKYVIVRTKLLSNPPKIMLTLRRPKGKVLHYSFVSPSGHISIPISWS